MSLVAEMSVQGVSLVRTESDVIATFKSFADQYREGGPSIRVTGAMIDAALSLSGDTNVAHAATAKQRVAPGDLIIAMIPSLMPVQLESDQFAGHTLLKMEQFNRFRRIILVDSEIQLKICAVECTSVHGAIRGRLSYRIYVAGSSKVHVEGYMDLAAYRNH